ncbi:uncharacterized protein V1510DRAFT_415930 [Dipodascopsis tothii]|uniref:uncharacterized protein n=1 Tax=Dipodascopsis tothii TaxID=44089 RepID=UPI0034CE5CA6
MPHPAHVFPWLHGLNAYNMLQMAFLDPQRTQVDYHPAGFRKITLVKVGNMNLCKLVGSVSPREILPDSLSDSPGFLDLSPTEGVGLRNFHIQIAKIATVSDIVVYSRRGELTEGLMGVAQRIAAAQREHAAQHPGVAEYSTFVVTDPFDVFERDHPETVAVNSIGACSESTMDFMYQERSQMSAMSAATSIGHNVWLGNVADITNADNTIQPSSSWQIYVNCMHTPGVPNQMLLDCIDREVFSDEARAKATSPPVAHIEFPTSGSLALGNLGDLELNALVDMCEWMHKHAAAGHGVLLFCDDGYTETSLLALAYVIYSTGVSAAQAYIDLHIKFGRPFFSFPADVTLLNHLQSRLLVRSPIDNVLRATGRPQAQPAWFSRLDGSLPSKIFSHMYLGNLLHADNHGLLRALGIKRILSVGETLSWTPVGDDEPDEDTENDANVANAPQFGSKVCNSMLPVNQSRSRERVRGFKVMFIDQIRDDGIDSLSQNIEQCLDFIDAGYRANEPTLVHCRVGVSRSASICIAEVMRRQKLSLAAAYLYVRIRRLNFIIQPNLRFMYELMKWEEGEVARAGVQPYRREIEWATLCKEISCMNRAYIP